MKFDFVEGEILLVDKPYTWSSFDIVKKTKYLFHIKKIGHAGTLDPLATGLMIMATGKKTKQLHFLQNDDKEYVGTITLGNTTPSYDLETEFDQTFETSHITKKLLDEAAKSFLGDHTQTPPIYSAVKVDGERAYKKARKGEEVKIKTREVFIHAFDIEKVDGLIIHFRIHCSKGTYIRSMANDFGKKLNSGAHLSSLKRTKVGEFKLEDAYTLDQLLELKESLESNT